MEVLATEIKRFLEKNKGPKKLTNVKQFFHDVYVFIRSARPLTRKSLQGEYTLTEQKVYSMRKLVVTVKAQILDEEV